MNKVALHTIGCKLNYAETSTIGRQFTEHGFEVVDFDQPSDVYVLNTCSVTERADRECRQIIRRALRTAPNAFVIVVGCYAQLQPEEIASIDGVDLVLGMKEKFNIFENIRDFAKLATPHVFVSCIDEASECTPAFSADIGGRTRAFLKIQDGCDFNCSFCTIPLARGGSRSLPLDQVVQRAEDLVSQGYKEIVLTGVNVGDYGKRIGTSLLELMHALELVDGLRRTRISSIEPNLLTREMVDFMLGSDKFCNHFHIPLQSGSDTILKRMRRRYLTGDYDRLVEYILEKDSDAAIGVDVIVGFPGESEALFEETYSFLDRLAAAYLHVFTYSERPGTPAAGFGYAVEPRVRFARSQSLRRLSRQKRQLFYSHFVGQRVPVLFEGHIQNGRTSGLTKNYVRVEAHSSSDLVNEICDVKVLDSNEEICLGEVLDSPQRNAPAARRQNAHTALSMDRRIN